MGQAFEDFKVYDTNIKGYVGDRIVKDPNKTYLIYDITDTAQVITVEIKANGIVDWGDGTIETSATAPELTHIYAKTGIYIITITGFKFTKPISAIPMILEAYIGEKGIYELPPNAFYQAGKLRKVCCAKDIRQVRNNCFAESNIEEIVFYNRSQLNLYSEAFFRCYKLHKFLGPPIYIQGSRIFQNATELHEIPEISGYDKFSGSAFNSSGIREVVNINSGIYNLSQEAIFTNATYLKSITFGSSETAVIHSREFAGCYNLREIICYSPTPYNFQGGFSDCKFFSRIIVPNGSGEKYRTATGWIRYKDLIVEVSQTTGMTQATETKLGGVKAVAKTTEMTEPVGIGTDGKLYSKSGGGGAEIVYLDAVADLPNVTTKPDGKIYAVNENGYRVFMQKKITKLSTPTVVVDKTTVSVNPPVQNATKYKVRVDTQNYGDLSVGASMDLSKNPQWESLSEGTHTVKVTAYADGYIQSDEGQAQVVKSPMGNRVHVTKGTETYDPYGTIEYSVAQDGTVLATGIISWEAIDQYIYLRDDIPFTVSVGSTTTNGKCTLMNQGSVVATYTFNSQTSYNYTGKVDEILWDDTH